MNDFQPYTTLELETASNSSTELEAPPRSTNSAEDTINGTPVSELSRFGYQHLRANNLPQAIECFRQILEHQPDNNYALVGIGDAYRKKGRFQDAANYYQRCLTLFPQNNYALFGLADCFRHQKQFHRAIAVWEDYLLIDGQNVTVLTRVADAYRKVRNLARGRELYLRVMEIEPDNAYALIGLGHLYYDFKEFDQALKCWQRMYELSQDQVDIRVLTSMGNCHRKMKTFQDGIRLFEAALRLEPENFYALFGIADCYRGLRQYQNSLVYWQRIIATSPTNRLILTRAGDAWRNLGDHDQARRLYQAALDVEFDVWAIHGLAQLARREGRHKEAAESLESLLSADIRLHRLYPDLLDAYDRSGNRSAVQETIERFRRLHPVHPRIVEAFDRLVDTIRYK